MPVIIRPATEDDQESLGRLAGALVRLHHTLDSKRFFLVEPIEQGYGRWLVRESGNPNAIVLVAEQEGKVVGYAYGTNSERDWMLLLDACGVLQDIYVDESARRGGVARQLVQTTCARFREKGQPRVVLSTAAKNETAQRFFESMGFRRTMIEMTCELSS